MAKQQLGEFPKLFNAKFLLVGDAGSGKTHLCGTYTLGPVHFYMIDPGGEKTLYKLNKNRPEGCEITIDIFDKYTQTYDDVWKTIQKDAADGFFDEMASRNGLVVLPDSVTNLADMALKEVARRNKRDLMSQNDEKKYGMRIQDWGQLGRWLITLVEVIGSMPCACACTAHLMSESDSKGNLLGRYPKIPGAIRYDIAKDFDEVYLVEGTKDGLDVYFRKAKLFQAKTRTIGIPKLINADMNMIANAYLKGDDLTSNKGGDKTQKSGTVSKSKVAMP